jgi:hypothetical protein
MFSNHRLFLAWVYSRRPAPGKYPFTLPDFIDYRDQNQSLSGIAAYASWSANLTDQGEPEQLQGLRISANAFDLLGVEAVAGRALLPGDDTPGQQHVVVLSSQFLVSISSSSRISLLTVLFISVGPPLLLQTQ